MEMWLSSQTTMRLPSFWWPHDRAGLVADALLDVAVADEAPDAVVERRGALRGVGVEQAALAAGRDRHADRVAQALAQRARRRLHMRPCGRARGDRASGCPTGAAAAGRRASARSRTGRAGCRASSWNGRTTGRNGRGRSSRDRSGRGASRAGTAGMRRGPGSWRCRDDPSPPSPLRPSPGLERRRPPACPGRSIQGLARVRCSSARSPESSCRGGAGRLSRPAADRLRRPAAGCAARAYTGP